jgi:hypothetical protein
MANKFGRFYAGYTLFFLGETAEAATFWPIDLTALGPDYHARVRVIKGEDPPPSGNRRELSGGGSPLDELFRGARRLRSPERLKVSQSFQSVGRDGGPVGLAALSRGVESKEVLVTLSRHRNHANKNKIEWNDPLLLVALAAANYSNNDYPQALETLFELAKSFEGLRGLQWNLQGVYAARQKSAGDARIAN